jgi:hypothetical protein
MFSTTRLWSGDRAAVSSSLTQSTEECLAIDGSAQAQIYAGSGYSAEREPTLRVALQNYTTRTVPALDIDAYAQKVYQANRSAGL